MAAEAPSVRFTATTPRTVLQEAVTHLSARAHSRIQHIVGPVGYPSAWDIAHAEIDRLLLLLEAR